MNYIEEAGSTLFHYSSADFIWSSGFVDVNLLKNFINIFFCYRDRGFMDFSFFEVRYLPESLKINLCQNIESLFCI